MKAAAAQLMWKKQGLLYGPERLGPLARHPYLKTHFANPLAIHIESDVFRIYYSGRDEKNRSSVGAVDIDIARREIVREYAEPFFVFGGPGSFFSAGVSIGCVYEVGDKRYMLFMGWQNESGRHWRGDIGRLILDWKGGLSLDREFAVIGVGGPDPLSLSYPWVEKLTHGGYRMWYGSTLSWDAGNSEMLHVLHGADSNDGHLWRKSGLAVPYIIGEVQAFSRPTVLRLSSKQMSGEEWAMWFSYRGGSDSKYRIGCARSRDGVTWRLANENVGIAVSPEGWDSEMIEYPFVFRHKERIYMLYNGNSYGGSGFGLAVLEASRDEGL